MSSVLLHLLRLLRIHSTPALQHHPPCAFRVRIEGNRFLSSPSPYVYVDRDLHVNFVSRALSKLFIKENREWEYGNQLGRIEIWFLDSLLMIRLLVFFDLFFFLELNSDFLIKLFESNDWIFILFFFFLNIAEVNRS